MHLVPEFFRVDQSPPNSRIPFQLVSPGLCPQHHKIPPSHSSPVSSVFCTRFCGGLLRSSFGGLPSCSYVYSFFCLPANCAPCPFPSKALSWTRPFFFFWGLLPPGESFSFVHPHIVLDPLPPASFFSPPPACRLLFRPVPGLFVLGPSSLLLKAMVFTGPIPDPWL